MALSRYNADSLDTPIKGGGAPEHVVHEACLRVEMLVEHLQRRMGMRMIAELLQYMHDPRSIARRSKHAVTAHGVNDLKTALHHCRRWLPGRPSQLLCIYSTRSDMKRLTALISPFSTSRTQALRGMDTFGCT